MKHPVTTRLLSMLLAIVLLMSCCPTALAADEEAPSQEMAAEELIAEAAEEETAAPADETEAPTEETEAPAEETTAPTEETAAPAEETEAPAEETEAPTEETTAPTETEEPEATEETAAQELLDSTEETTEPTEETEPGELIYGLTGLPKDYVLTEQMLAEKQAMSDNAVAQDTRKLAEGTDYEANVIVANAESQAEAEAFAAAFNGELESFAYGIAKIRLLTVSVSEAVEAAQDMSLPLPAAYPDYIVRLWPEEAAKAGEAEGTSTFAARSPAKQNWNTWVNENLSNPDRFLLYPFNVGYYGDYQYAHDMVDSYAAWGATTGSSDVVVAVLDTGVYAGHEELSGKVVRKINVGEGTGDQNGHGTHVAGIIAATMNNGTGGAGIAPNVRIMDVRVLDADGSGSNSVISRGIRAAADNGADIINMSLGGPSYSGTMQSAITYAVKKGVTVIAAMGNDGSNVRMYPAAYSGVIAVAAVDSSGHRAPFSNYGSWADVAAPGVNIISSYYDGYYEWMDGTSQATPIVSGVAALYKSLHPTATPAQIESKLKSTATPCGSNMGAGIVNAAKMLSTKPNAPGFNIYSSSGTKLASSSQTSISVACTAKLRFYTRSADDNEYILYTLDGKTPSVVNGSVVNGTPATGDIDLMPYAGKTITVKAAQINGLGMTGEVLTRKITVYSNKSIDRVEVSGPSSLVAGKSGQYKAKVFSTDPSSTAQQSVSWSIVSYSSGLSSAKISSSGVLTTPSGKSGTLTIRATSKADSSKSDTFEVEVKKISPVAKMKLSATELSVRTKQSKQLTVKSYTAKGYLTSPEVSWSSSNTSVATVDSSGNVTGKAKGTATITCKALDGSNVSVKCTVTVWQGVTSIGISGQETIAPGSSGTFKASVRPSTAANKKVKWYLSSAPTGVTISSTGVVKVPSGCAVGSTITFYAKSQDGTGIESYKTVTVAAKCSSVRIKEATYSGLTNGVTTDTWGNIKTLELFTQDLPGSKANERCTTLTAFTKNSSGYTDTPLSWKSSSSSVASVDQYGNVTAKKAGTATITATALDGSGQSHSVTVKVLVPVSSLTIYSSAPQRAGSGDGYYLAYGKSVTNKVRFLDTYGVPTNQKVTWDYSVDRVSSNWDTKDVTSTVKSKKLLSLSDGKLTISSKMKDYRNSIGGELRVTVWATATDGTLACDAISYWLVSPATVMKIEDGYSSVRAGRNQQYVVSFYCNQRFPFSNNYWADFTITSSDPNVAGAYDVYHPRNYKDGWYDVYFATGTVSGTAKITIKATDGSGKSCSFTVNVY